MSINIRKQQAYKPVSSVPDFRLNFLQVTFSTDQFSAGVLPFESRDQLRTLRVQFAATNVLQRQMQEIICIPLTAEAPMLGIPRVYMTHQAPGLVRKLLQEAVLRLLRA